MEEQSTEVSDLTVMTFKELFDMERLPSGHSFELMPDTVENALSVAEASDVRPWKEKVLQAFAVTSKIGTHNVQEQGFTFLSSVLDTDLIFLGLAWSAQLNGMTFKLEEPAPCPSCGAPFHEIGFGGMKVHVRESPLETPGVWKIDGIEKTMLPKSLHNGDLMCGDMTWEDARKNVSETTWENQDVINIHRVMASLKVSSGGKLPRHVVSAESRKMSARALKHVAAEMNKHIPYFEPGIDLECQKCKSVSTVPFNQGLG